MRILQLYNRYQSGGGGETRVVSLVEQVLKADGHEVQTLFRDSGCIDSLAAKVNAAVNAPYAIASKRLVRQRLTEWRPDVVHIHNLYPLFSPSVLKACREEEIPVVMTVHNYRLTCPSGNHFLDGAPCVRCLGGQEYQCVVNNCEQDLFKSTSYAFRSFIARSARQFHEGVTLFLAVSSFVKEHMIQAGYDSHRIRVLENAVPTVQDTGDQPGDHVLYLGRMEPEKGVAHLLEAAAQLPSVPFTLIGDGPHLMQYVSAASPNCSFVGHLDHQAVSERYRTARMVVIPSLWWEPFGLVAVEAMSYGKPVIAARSGALPEIVLDGVCGLTYEAGNANQLAEKIVQFWKDPALAVAMGRKGREIAITKYDVKTYAQRLTAAYEEAKGICGRPPGGESLSPFE